MLGPPWPALVRRRDLARTANIMLPVPGSRVATRLPGPAVIDLHSSETLAVNSVKFEVDLAWHSSFPLEIEP